MLNRHSIIGRLGRDPEVKQTQSGDTVCNLSVATTESWKDKATGEKKEKTEWHRVVVWPPSSDYVEKYGAKGRLVFVEGPVQTRSWEDKSGNKKYSTETVVGRFGCRVSFLDQGDKQPDQDTSDTSTEDTPELDDDIPF